MNQSQDTFRHKSEDYAVARPKYPRELFDWVASQCVSHEAVWDCATGNGQAAVDLSSRFRQVYATDVSPEQIENSFPGENIRYWVASAEASGLADNSVDLVAVAQALHWFDFPRFWEEVRRVSVAGGLFAAWGYDWLSVNPRVDVEVIRPFRAILEPFWAPNNRILWQGYKTEAIQFPFDRLSVPNFAIEMRWTLSQILAYMRTWSAYKRSRNDPGALAAMDALMERTHQSLADDEVLTVRMPLKVVAGRVTAGGRR